MPYFTTLELRQLPDMDNAPKYPDERLEAAHDWIAGIVERVCDTSFIEREHTETLSGGLPYLSLNYSYAREVTAVTVDGEVVDADGVVIDSDQLFLSSQGCWAGGRRNVAVTYTAGYSDTPPVDLKEAMLRAARNWLITMHAWSGVDERQTSITNEFGNVNLATPGDGRPTGLPMVDTVIMGWAERVRIPKVH